MAADIARLQYLGRITTSRGRLHWTRSAAIKCGRHGCGTRCDSPSSYVSRISLYRTQALIPGQGSAIQVFGTLDTRGGILHFNVDGVEYPPFSRASILYICDAALFQSPVLYYGNHVLSAILFEEELDLRSNATVAYNSVLSIQRMVCVPPFPFRYRCFWMLTTAFPQVHYWRYTSQ